MGHIAMRYFGPALLTLAVAACAPPVPDSNPDSGVGFEDYRDYNSYRAEREAALTGGPEITATELAEADTPVEDTTVVVAEAETETTTETETFEVAAAETTAATPVAPNNTNISDEQDFDAVAGRETIESDRERIEERRQNYEVIAPEPVPTRSGDTGPNIVAYALATTNRVGQQLYTRSVFSGEARFQRNCARYVSADLAQEAFLGAGGPDRDRMGIDPDGDGFACSWDPTPYRQINTAGQ